MPRGPRKTVSTRGMADGSCCSTRENLTKVSSRASATSRWEPCGTSACISAAHSSHTDVKIFAAKRGNGEHRAQDARTWWFHFQNERHSHQSRLLGWNLLNFR